MSPFCVSYSFLQSVLAKTLTQAETATIMQVIRRLFHQAPPGTSGGDNSKPQIKDVQINEQLLQISAEKLTHIDTLVSQQMVPSISSNATEEEIAKAATQWQKAIQDYTNASSISLKEICTIGNEIEREQTFKYATVNGNQNTSVQKITATTEEVYFGIFENSVYNTYQRKKSLVSDRNSGWEKTTEPISIGMLSNVNILNLSPKYLATLFTFDQTAKGYTTYVGDIAVLIKFENDKIVYIEQKYVSTVKKTYFCDYDSTTVQLPQEIKALF